MEHNGNETFVVEPIDHMMDKLNVDAVFGEPQHEGEVTIIPVAQVRYGFGMGQGSGRTGDEGKETADSDEKGEGSGSGGGGGGSAKPQGFLRITPEGVSYEPITHPERLMLAGIALVGWAIFWVGMTIGAIARAFARPKK